MKRARDAPAGNMRDPLSTTVLEPDNVSSVYIRCA